MRYSHIGGTGSYLPEKILTNADLEKLVETSSDWIMARTGIAERHIIAEDQQASDMAFFAAQKAISAAGIDPQQIDLIIVATATPDYIFPSTACLLQSRLGVNTCPAFDIQAACAGFNYGLSIADQYIRSGSARTALVVGSEAMSRLIDWSDRTTCILFGDGAGAVVLTASDKPGILSTHIHADGIHQDKLYVPNDLRNKGAARLAPHLVMQGSEVFKIAVKTLGAVVDETLAHNKLEKTAVNWLIPHQANHRIIEATAKKLNLPMERVVMTVAAHGNTSSASIPLALDTAVRDGRIQRGDVLLLESFGAGFAWGSALIRY
jgi:3-oxoacyl-[acyl-carrier-protein] synthase III